MEKQEKNKTEQNPMPLGMILDHAREDMTKSVVALQQKYGLPASLLDVILTGVLSEVREMKCMEYRQLKEGEYCEKLYSQMLEAYERVCRRLGKPGTEDEDVEIIISNLMSIGRHQSMKMFDYGVLFTERENKQ